MPSIPPYNTFHLSCEPDAPEYLESIPFEIRWIRETGSDQQETVTSDDLTTIETSLIDSKPVSVLTATRVVPGQYVYYCEIEYEYGEEDLIAYSFSNYRDVTLTGK